MIEIYGIVFTLIIGTLLHFVFEWSGRNLLVSFIAPTNESVFEHLKLLVTPFLLWSLIEYVHYGQFSETFIPAKTAGLFAGMFTMVFVFYAYTAIFGRNFLIADIGLFILSVLVAFAVSHYLMDSEVLGQPAVGILADVSLFLMAVCFAVFTVYPPSLPLFSVPVTAGRN